MKTLSYSITSSLICPEFPEKECNLVHSCTYFFASVMWYDNKQKWAHKFFMYIWDLGFLWVLHPRQQKRNLCMKDFEACSVPIRAWSLTPVTNFFFNFKCKLAKGLWVYSIHFDYYESEISSCRIPCIL